jgi:hypothetical protein
MKTDTKAIMALCPEPLDHEEIEGMSSDRSELDDLQYWLAMSG